MQARMKWSNGRHNYHGKTNSRSQRFASKLGVKKGKAISAAFKKIAEDKAAA